MEMTFRSHVGHDREVRFLLPPTFKAEDVDIDVTIRLAPTDAMGKTEPSDEKGPPYKFWKEVLGSCPDFSAYDEATSVVPSVEPVARDENGWPMGFFERTAGQWKGPPMERPSQGEYKLREALQ